MNTNVIFLGFTALLLVLLPLAAAVFWKHKHRETVSWKAFLLGAVGFFLSARVLELGVHMFCIVNDNPVSRFINGNTLAYVLYGITMAGVFEECGRYLMLRFFLKKNRNPDNIVMYGIGHGGIEVWLISLTAILSYLMIALAIAQQGLDGAMSAFGVTAESSQSFEAVVASVSSFGLSMSIMTVVERIFAMVFHVFATQIVFLSLHKNDKKYLLLAVLAHMILDIVPALSQRGIASVWMVEIWLAACCVGLYYLIKSLYKNTGLLSEKQA